MKVGILEKTTPKNNLKKPGLVGCSIVKELN